MNLRCTADGRSLTAHIGGELDHHHAKEVMEALNHQLDMSAPDELTIDLGGLSFTDSSGIAVLIRTSRRMKQLGGTMRVVSTPSQAQKVFHAAGLERLITFEGGKNNESK